MADAYVANFLLGGILKNLCFLQHSGAAGIQYYWRQLC